MDAQFKKGQLVAARDIAGESWALVKYNHKADHKHSVERIAEAVLLAQNYNYKECLPAEEVWPDIFLGRERRAGEQAAEAVAMESELVQRLRRQIRWLSEQLDQINSGRDEMCDCPEPELRFPMRPMDCDPEGCVHCWEQASLKAVEKQQ